MISRLLKLNGGVHPPEHKLESTSRGIAAVPLAQTLVLPLRQHVGNLPKILVQPGEHVLKGQQLAEAVGSISAAVHAPTSGVIVSIEDQLIPHPSGLPDVSITLKADGEDRWMERKPVDWRNTERLQLVAGLRESGIVGMGGAAFPTQIKLRPGGGSGIKTLIINGAECEPYITCDDVLMRERADEIVKGIVIANYILAPERIIVGIEDNKPEAVQAMREACAKSDVRMDVIVVPTLYPSGDARRLAAILTGIEVPSDKRSSDAGLQVFNVATMMALYRYLELGETVVSRIVTVTGNVARPGNFEVPLGTPMGTLLEAAGGTLPNTNELIMGGPMMGFSLPSNDVPVIKATNCIIAGAPLLFPAPPPALACIRCARCAEACPVSLQPQELYWFAKSQNLEKAREYNLFDCIECGCCSYVCPSNIPLVQYYRFAKSEIIAQDKAKEAANLARERNEFRLSRIEREKQERAAKHAQRAAGAKAENAGDTSDADEAKKVAIAAAMERAKAQKEEAPPKNTDNISETAQAEIAAIDARRAEQKNAEQEN
ncbi:MAG: electron transport complex subunit RsxC [Methylobacillus sp.]|jgi:electron transport complex protein RnfC|nr:electron transport complex subunit RsxC [Methylobacillus sp.]